MNWKFIRNVIIRALVILLLLNLLFVSLDSLSAAGSLSLYNHLIPGRTRFPYGEDPAKAYNLNVYNLNALFASHQIDGQRKAPDEYRVLLVGDSSVWGTLLHPEETLAGQLDTLGLNAAAGKQIKFYNLGYPTMSTTKDLLIFERAVKYQPDLIIWPVTLESLVKANQANSPLVLNNLDQAAALARKYALSLDLPAQEAKTILNQNLYTRRRDLADLVRLQVYGLMWTATGIDQYYPPVYSLAARDFEADASFHGLQDPLKNSDLSLDVLKAGVQMAGNVTVLFINEPILISDGTNSDIRYNFYYPRWAYDEYRKIMTDESARNGWLYLDLWNQVPDSEFTNTAVHFSPMGEQIIASTLGGILPETIQTGRIPEQALLALNAADAQPEAVAAMATESAGQPSEANPTEPAIQTTLVPDANTPAAAETQPAESPAATTAPAQLLAVVPTSGVCQPPEKWEEMPVIPSYVSEKAKRIYQEGLKNGNDPRVFSVIGDCQNVPQVFMGVFDNPKDYKLGSAYAYLSPAIDQFKGSFNRKGMARKGGLNVAAILSPLRADPNLCDKGETPLQCELRKYKPSIVIVSMEEWWSKNPVDIYEGYMRKVLDEIIAHGAVPVLVTKADNLEGDQALNKVIVKLACEYEIPLWNFWGAVQPLPNHGLWTDGFHLTVGLSDFTNATQMKTARPTRNLTGLQTLYQVWIGLNQ